MIELDIKNVILEYVEEHPGASAKRILGRLRHINDSLNVKEDNLKSIVYKNLRLLRSKGKLHSNRNSWYVLKRNNS